MCIVCFHFWISNLTFVLVLKKRRSNNTQKRVFWDSTSKSIPSSYPSKHSRPLSFSKEKQSDAWSKNAILLSHWTRFSTSFHTVKIYFVRQKTSPKISDNFPMALRGKMLTRFHRNPYLHFSGFFVQFTWSATTTITTPEHVSGIRRYGMATFYVIRWMTYCEGAILSLTHSLTHSLTPLLFGL